MAQRNWLIVNSPNPPSPANNIPAGVTCVSASNCWAVGSSSHDSAWQTLIEHWDGTAWDIVSSPNSSPTQGNYLTGVSCMSASNCLAVGYYNDGSNTAQTLIERWNGNSWSIEPSPNTSPTQSNYLTGVTCASASDCWAIGYYSNGGAVFQTLIEHWDGTAWAIVSSPNTSAAQTNLLFGATCTSASDCWAAGYYVTGSTYQTLIVRWDGTAWAIVSSPNTSVTQLNLLLGVTCASASNCWSVGYHWTGSASQTLIERWDGTSWTIVSSPNVSPTQSNELFGVTCASASDCWAVGFYYISSVAQTLIEHWNGTAWTIVSSPNTPYYNELQGVTCVAGTECWAVGRSLVDNVSQTLLGHWNGSAWTIVSSPNTLASQTSALQAVTCVSASDCWAVGSSYVTGKPRQTLIEHWDGTSWATVNSPSINNTGTQSDWLAGVTCVSASDCWAVGYYSLGNAAQTLIEHWDGSSWTIVDSPNTNTAQSNLLNSVTCVSASECWAVGHYRPSGTTYQTLIQRWNGTAWAIVTSPNALLTQSNYLYGVTCASAVDCWAVGSAVGSLAVQTLAEHWDGAAWAVVSSPNSLISQLNYLYAATCVSASECWAIGYSYNGNNYQTLIERWDGSSWATVSSPNSLITQDNELYGVRCASASNCWAVGYYLLGNAAQTLIEHWDGSSWAIVNSPNAIAAENNYLFGVTCTPASDCWAVGYYKFGQTLVLRYTANPPPIPVNVVSRKTHGSVGTFDIDLPLTGPLGVECRSGGENGDHQIVVTFPNPVTVSGDSVTSSDNQATADPPIVNNATVTINLHHVSNAQTISVTLAGVNDGTNNGNVSIPMSVLLGDTTADRFVNSGDIAQTKSQSGNSVSASNFREDVTADGSINSGDIALVKSASGTALP